MGLFDTKKNPLELQGFRTRRDAFSAMLQYLINEKSIEPMEAAKQADEFANLFAKNMGLPERIESPKTGIDLWLANLEKASAWAEKNPKIIEIGKPILTGAFSALLGAFAGAKINQDTQEDNTIHEQINFDQDYGTTELETIEYMGGLPDGETRDSGTGDIKKDV